MTDFWKDKKNIKYLKKPVSEFFFKQKLTDFIENSSDQDKEAQAYLRELNQSVELKKDSELIKQGKKFGVLLKEVHLRDSLQNKMEIHEPLSQEVIKILRFGNWSVQTKSALALSLFAILTYLTLFFTPWQKIVSRVFHSQNEQVILAEETKVKQQVDLAVIEKTEAPQFTDDKPIAAEAPVETKKEIENIKNQEQPQKEVVDVKATEKAQASTGFLYRGVVSITNVKDTKGKITEKIIEAGGRKAGSVELGWNKNPQTAYYHFTIPESKLKEVQDYISQYGQLEFKKEKHPRQMPDGISRVIVEVKEKMK